MARVALRAGRSVVIANSRGPNSLTSVISALGEGVTAGTPADAAGAAVVVIAVPWDRVPAAVHGLHWDGQVIIDATNDCAAGDLDGRTSSEIVAGLATGGAMQQIHHPLAGINLIRL